MPKFIQEYLKFLLYVASASVIVGVVLWQVVHSAIAAVFSAIRMDRLLG